MDAGVRVKRLFDATAALAGLILLSPLLLGLAIVVRVSSAGPALHWSRRVGRGNGIFAMPKFRTMRTGAPDVATHLLANPDQWVTPIGRFLRRTSLDELPQLWSILKGDMSLVGPRPALFNQDDLVALRTQAGVEALRPGLTGWAQVQQGYADSADSTRVKLSYDLYYVAHYSLALDLLIAVKTVRTVLTGFGAR